MSNGKRRSQGWTALYWSVAALRVVLRLCGVAVVVGMVCPAVEAQTAHFAGYGAAVQTGTTLSSPFAVYVDSTETYAYVADLGNHRVIRVAISGGAVTNVNLYNASTNANCASPVGVVADATGSVYFSCTDTATIYKATYSGGSYTLSTFRAGVTNTGPRGLAIDASGNIYIAVQYSGTGNAAYILKCSTSGSCSTFYTFAANTSGVTYSPQAVAVDTSGNLYITDVGTAEAVYKLSGTTLTNIQSCPQLAPSYAAGCYGVAVDANGVVYMGANQPKVYKLTPNGSGGYTSSTVYAAPGLIYRAVGIALNASGTTLYAADYTDGGQNLGNGLSGPNPSSTNLVRFGVAGQGFGSVAVGSTSSSALPVTFSFDTAGTLGGIAALTNGQTSLDFTNAGTGTCNTTTSFSAGSSCTVNVSFTPTRVGLRTGAVVLKNGSGAVIATAYVYGTGVGPLVNFATPTTVTVDGSLSGAEGLAGDANGNLYVAAGGTHVYKETLSNGSYAESQITTGTLSGAQWVTQDAAGDLFIANASSTTILKETPSGSGYTETTAVSLTGPNEVAVDAGGNLYTASGDVNGVYKFTLQSNGTYVQSQIATNSNNPWGVAVDGAGNVFYTGANNGYLYRLTPSGTGYTQATVATGLANPVGIAIDSNGNIYVANDATSGPVNKLTYNASNSGCSTSLASCYTNSIVTTGVKDPVGIWVDANDNVFIGDTGNNRVLKLDYSDGPTVSFASTAVGSQSAATTLTVENVGSSALTFTVPLSGTNPAVSANFGWTSTGGTACPALTTSSMSAGTLAAGSTCTLPVYFAPVSGTSDTGTLVLTDNSASGTTQTVSLSGTATYSAPTVTGVAPSSGTAGTSVTITGTNLLGATSVMFGSNAGTITADTATSLTVTAPAGSTGAVNVTVTTPGGSATRTGGFTYLQTLTSLTVSGYSSSAITTEGGTVTVTALDQNGNTYTGFTGTVTLTSSDGAATLPAAYAFTGADAGVHTFSVTLKTLGTQSITATSGGVTGSETGIMVDDAMWVENVSGTLSKLNVAGTALVTGVGTGNIQGLRGGAAVDAAGGVWSVSSGVNTLYFASAMGTGTTNYTGGGLNAPVSVAVDGAGMVWVLNGGGASVSEFTSAGTAVSPSSGYGSSYPAGDRMNGPYALAIDSAGGVWVTDRTVNSVTHIFGAATPVVTPVAAATSGGKLGTEP